MGIKEMVFAKYENGKGDGKFQKLQVVDYDWNTERRKVGKMRLDKPR